ncbi:hypothetical protein Nepgr_008394 [Nepenthes gracilis]|uniref:very-long-chain 3-oxoacyl-CoA synthase n=1 Tax=Nepenthes gracilis TaxID=150966 RepID=A0AAD3XJ84_NEPGR|nr:hypothetical protein Nepgr_008394 [Nepenthes gracilis]
MESIHGAMRYWLVEHPTVSDFEWKNGTTWGASLQFLIPTVSTYLSLTFLLSHSPLPTLRPSVLRLASTVHNFTILLLSLLMAVGCSLSALSQLPHPQWIFCFPSNQIPPRGPLFFWAYVFYISKIIEFVDTLLIILAGSIRRLSFLHVYHHATVVVMSYIWLETSQSLFPIALVTNASVHTLMYAYYLLSGLGFRPSWKRLVTDCQIIQFVISFLLSGVMLFYHFARFRCSGIWGWCFNAIFNASLLYLFVDFHSKNYARKKLLQNGEDKPKSS